MLTHLCIKNFTIVDELSIEFFAGMSALTGETGAGKSLLFDALEYCLGARGDTHVIRVGAQRCEISATFSVKNLPDAQLFLRELDLDEGDECIVRRSINTQGRSKSFINSAAVTLQQTRALSELLINIHGQHEHQSLMKRETHQELLDAYGEHQSLLAEVAQIAKQFHETEQQLQQLQSTLSDAARCDLLRYQVAELDELNLQQDEVESLQQQHKILANAEGTLQKCSQLLSIFSNSEDASLQTLLYQAQQILQSLHDVDARFATCQELIATALINVQEAESDLENYVERLEINPEQLREIDQRLEKIYAVARKHHVHVAQLAALHQQLTEQLQLFSGSEKAIEQLQSRLLQLRKQYAECAATLSQARQRAGKKLETDIVKLVQQLGMPHAAIHIHFEKLEHESVNARGAERVEFFVSANPGSAPQPLQKVASGGELSRISLAIQVATIKGARVPTLLFDEVDVGIGGATAEIVGKLLKQLALDAQIFCVTHQAQVAAQANQHYRVSKISDANSTVSRIELLDKKSRVDEIARMMGGVTLTKQTIAHAKEMLAESY